MRWRLNITDAYLKDYLKQKIAEWFERQGTEGRFEDIATVSDNLDIIHSEDGIEYRTRVVSYQYYDSVDSIYRNWEALVRTGKCESVYDFVRNHYMGAQR